MFGSFTALEELSKVGVEDGVSTASLSGFFEFRNYLEKKKVSGDHGSPAKLYPDQKPTCYL